MIAALAAALVSLASTLAGFALGLLIIAAVTNR